MRRDHRKTQRILVLIQSGNPLVASGQQFCKLISRRLYYARQSHRLFVCLFEEVCPPRVSLSQMTGSVVIVVLVGLSEGKGGWR